MRQLGLSLGGPIRSFEKARRTRQQQDAETLELAKRAGMDPQSAAHLALRLAPIPKPQTEPFIMLQPAQNAAVVRWLRVHSKRPQAQLHCGPSSSPPCIHRPTKSCSHVLILPRELASIRCVSRIMTELVSIDAIVRRKEGRRVVYSMNPNVATHVAGPEAREEIRKAAPPAPF